MVINTFEPLVKTERSATCYIAKFCWEKHRRFCLRCKNHKIYAIRRQRYRCKCCKYEFSDWTGRWIGRLSISAKDWLWIVKLFELEISAMKASRQLNLSNATVLKAFEIIRQSLMSGYQERELLSKEKMECDVSGLSNPQRGNPLPDQESQVPVFGILEHDGIVGIERVPDVTPEMLLNTTVQWVRQGSIVYTDQFRGYDSLIFRSCRYRTGNHPEKFGSGKVYIDGLKGFWVFAKDRLNKNHDVPKSYFPSYLKELEFRYNHRGVSIFELIIKALCQPLSNL
ncbi:MAG: IS1595 family transposase [Nitrospiria bacterium]